MNNFEPHHLSISTRAFPLCSLVGKAAKEEYRSYSPASAEKQGTFPVFASFLFSSGLKKF